MLHCTVHQKRKRKVLLNQFFARLQLSDESWRDCVGDDEAVLCVFPVQLLCMQHQHESGEWRKMKEPVNWTVRADHGCPRCQIHVIPVTYWLVGCRVGGDKLTSCLDQSSDRTLSQLLSGMNQIPYLSVQLGRTDVSRLRGPSCSLFYQ